MKRVPETRDPCCVVRPSPEGQAAPTYPSADAEIAATCKALAHPVRVQVLRHLLEAGTCVFGSVAQTVPLAPSTVAQHLQQLKAAGLVQQWDDGQHSCYCVSRDRVERLRALLAEL